MIFPEDIRRTPGKPSVSKMSPSFKLIAVGSVKFEVKTVLPRGGLKRCRKWGILSRDYGPNQASGGEILPVIPPEISMSPKWARFSKLIAVAAG